MSLPTHYIRSVYSGLPSSSSLSASTSSSPHGAQARFPPGLGFGSSVWRTADSEASSTPLWPSDGPRSGERDPILGRGKAIYSTSQPPIARPKPNSRHAATTIEVEPLSTKSSSALSFPPPQVSASQTYVVKLPSSIPPRIQMASTISMPESKSNFPLITVDRERERNARSKLVAGLLLYRVSAGRPMRRRSSPCAGISRGYVRSGLSVVSYPAPIEA